MVLYAYDMPERGCRTNVRADKEAAREKKCMNSVHDVRRTYILEGAEIPQVHVEYVCGLASCLVCVNWDRAANAQGCVTSGLV